MFLFSLLNVLTLGEGELAKQGVDAEGRPVLEYTKPLFLSVSPVPQTGSTSEYYQLLLVLGRRCGEVTGLSRETGSVTSLFAVFQEGEHPQESVDCG